MKFFKRTFTFTLPKKSKPVSINRIFKFKQTKIFDRCLIYFHSQAKLNSDKEYCVEMKKYLNLSKPKYIFDKCLHYFHCQAKLNSNEEYYVEVNKCKISFPMYQFIEFLNLTNKDSN